MQQKKKHIVIIGAGPAGLTAALELIRKEYAVTVLEATDRIGGISQTVRYGGNRMDIGGHRFFTKDEEVNAWWQQMLPLQGAPAWDDLRTGAQKEFAPDGPDPERCDTVMLLRDRVSRIYFKHHFFDYPVSLKWSTIRNMGFVTTMRAGFSYLYACIHKLPETSLENFYVNRFGRVLYSMFFESYTEKLWGRHPRDISADWGAQRVKGLSIRAIFKDIFRKLFHTGGQVETSLIEQFHYPKFGPGQPWELVADKAREAGAEIRMECPVVSLKQRDGRICAVTIRTETGEEEINGDVFLSSMPVRDLLAHLEGETIPNSVAEAAAALPYRDFVTVGLLLKELKIQNNTKRRTVGNRIPDCWIYVQDKGVKLGRVQLFNNWSPYMVQNPQDTVWAGLEYFCTEGDDMWCMSDAQWRQLAEKELTDIGLIQPGAVLDGHVERIKKAYPAYFDGYAHMGEITAYLNSVENLYCIGRNGQHRYNNMDHSMATAFAAVRAIEGEGNKEALWQVNTEQSYHESKA